MNYHDFSELMRYKRELMTMSELQVIYDFYKRLRSDVLLSKLQRLKLIDQSTRFERAEFFVIRAILLDRSC